MSQRFAQDRLRGRLIAVEGLDGAGIATQVHLLQRWLEQQGLKVYFSEWNSSELVNAATNIAKKQTLLTPTTFSLLHATDFADRYERHLLPLVRAGYLVLCDRYIYTAFARDVVRGCPSEWVREIYEFAEQPHITFFFNARLEVSLRQMAMNPTEFTLAESGRDLKLAPDPEDNFRLYQDRLLEQYLALGSEFQFVNIDAEQSVEAQQAVVRKITADRIDLPSFARHT